jgi:hypothetical protein
MRSLDHGHAFRNREAGPSSTIQPEAAGKRSFNNMRRSRWPFIACFACSARRTGHKQHTLMYTFPTLQRPTFAHIKADPTPAQPVRARASAGFGSGNTPEDKDGFRELGILKAATVHQEFRVLRRGLNVAVRKKILPANPCAILLDSFGLFAYPLPNVQSRFLLLCPRR